jgi:hypothetical protein
MNSSSKETQMTVWICYECSYNGCDQWETAMKAFDCEEKAKAWQEEKESTDYEWRDYSPMEVK